MNSIVVEYQPLSFLYICGLFLQFYVWALGSTGTSAGPRERLRGRVEGGVVFPSSDWRRAPSLVLSGRLPVAPFQSALN